MLHLRRIGLALLLSSVGIESAQADVYTVPLPGTVTVTSVNNPFVFTAPNVPAVTGLLGYQLTGNWTAISPPPPNDPFSAELRMRIQPAGGTLSPYRYVGGLDDSNPFTFGTFINNGAAFNAPGTPLLNFPAGDYTVHLGQELVNGMETTAQIANGTVSFFSNPSTVSGTTAGGPVFIRPDIGTGTNTPGNPNEPDVAYAVNSLTVSVSGNYMFVNETAYDGVVILYENAFNPSSPTPVVNAGDYPIPPFLGFGDTFVANLTAGTTYFLVSTGYDTPDVGPYTAYAAGPGQVTFNPIPEPGLTLFVASTALTVGACRRRRKSLSVI